MIFVKKFLKLYFLHFEHWEINITEIQLFAAKRINILLMY